jgi:anti-sigma regulatory factor (Ser/Thr protein kinase)
MAMATTAERAWCVSIPHHPRGAGVARARLQAELLSEIAPDLLDNAVTVIAELVGNAIRHGQPLPGDVVRVAWRVRYADDGADVTVTVTDGGSDRRPTVQKISPDSIDGRGLAIVEALSTSWGFERDGLGQTVWAEIRHSPIAA